MRIRLVLSVILLGISAIVLGVPVSADVVSTATVAATVTPAIVSVSVAPGTISYGVLPFGIENAAPEDDPFITATNDGTLTEDFYIKGASATPVGGGGPSWTLVGWINGDNKYVHKFGKGETPPEFFAMGDCGNGTELAADVEPSADQGFKLRITLSPWDKIKGMEPPFGAYSVPVTVTATAGGD